MKNVLLKFAGLFVERVPVDERGNPVPTQAPGPRSAPNQPPMQQQAMPQQAQQQGMPMQPAAGMPAQAQPLQGMPMVQQQAGGDSYAHAGAQAPIAVALRAWVPQEYAAHLAPFGVHVIAAGGSVTSEQARGWGADVLVVSAECLGQDVHLLQQPQLATVLITPQPVMLPEVPGVMQVQEPLRASDVAQAAREAAIAFAAARR
jgi:hypothetical protein